MKRVECSWCGRVRVTVGEEPIRDTRDITHSVCPDCFRKSMSGVISEDKLNKSMEKYMSELVRDNLEWVEDKNNEVDKEIKQGIDIR